MIKKLKSNPAILKLNASITPFKKYSRPILVGMAVIIGTLLCLAMANQIFLSLAGINGHDYNPLHFIENAFVVWSDPNLKGKWLLAAFIPGGLIGAIIVLTTQQKQNSLLGRAHWATFHEAKKAGLFTPTGILLGKKWHRYLYASGYEHIFIFAPSGSGKSTSLVIPNLLNWNGSCIALDVKLSLFKLTSKFRTQYSNCFLWHPGTRDEHTHAYNPLDWISQDPIRRIDDIQKIAHIFIPDNPKQDPIWVTQPRILFTALILYLLDTPEKPNTLGEMIRIIKNTNNFPAWVRELIEQRHDLDPLCYRNFNSFLQSEHRLQTNILQSFISYFELFDNPLIDAATSRSDFNITELRATNITIYVGVSPDNLVRLSPLITVFYQQVLDVLLRTLPDTEHEPHGVLLLLDEFSALRRMDNLQTNIGLMREYRVRMMILIQDLPQLYHCYGYEGAKAFINNKYRIAFAQNDLDSAKLISGWLGEKTIEQRTRNQGGNMTLNRQNSISYTRRELMKPDEIMQLHKNKILIIIEGNPPIIANKNYWYDDPNLKSRAIGEITIPKIRPVLVEFDRSSLKPTATPQNNTDKKDNNNKTDTGADSKTETVTSKEAELYHDYCHNQ